MNFLPFSFQLTHLREHHIEVYGCDVKRHSSIATSYPVWGGLLKWPRVHGPGFTIVSCTENFKYFYLFEETTQMYKFMFIPNLLETVVILKQCLLVKGKIMFPLCSPLHHLTVVLPFSLIVCWTGFVLPPGFYGFVTPFLTSQPSRPKKLICGIETLSYACSSPFLFKL